MVRCFGICPCAYAVCATRRGSRESGTPGANFFASVECPSQSRECFGKAVAKLIRLKVKERKGKVRFTDSSSVLLYNQLELKVSSW